MACFGTGMGYNYTCDGCGGHYETFPPFAGEFTETFLKTTGGKFAMGFKPGQKVTLCADCMELQVLTGKVVTCYRCGMQAELKKDSPALEQCPRCENDSLTLRGWSEDD